MITNLKKQS